MHLSISYSDAKKKEKKKSPGSYTTLRGRGQRPGNLGEPLAWGYGSAGRHPVDPSPPLPSSSHIPYTHPLSWGGVPTLDNAVSKSLVQLYHKTRVAIGNEKRKLSALGQDGMKYPTSELLTPEVFFFFGQNWWIPLVPTLCWEEEGAKLGPIQYL